MKKKIKKDKCVKKKSNTNVNDYKMIRPVYPKNISEYEPIISSIKFYKIPNSRPVRVYCDGVYDVFHYGHARSLKQAKFLFPNVHLIVGVTSDKSTNLYKGPTVYSERERSESLSHCKYVDEIIEDCPWIITDEFITKHNIDFIAHDEAPYKHGDNEDIYKIFKDRGIFIPLMRSKGISTSKIITNIVKDYDKYIIRNIERGITAKELNISFLELNRLKITKIIKYKIKRIKDDIKSELRYANMYWDTVICNIVNKIRNEKERIIEALSKM
ncbi:choline-phosphate cytidylyltransferase A [Vairimorpha necatrix]|uniref:choline-phosphate cytidylyltransferase n=1 Tax=Vairimorpha necatrix TaxID=6039 RepID=A0AAX4JEW9_9MICR